MSGQLVLADRVLIGIVFVMAAVGKLRPGGNFAGFVVSLAPLGVPVAIRRPLAVVVVLAEATTLVLVVLPPTVTVGLGLAALVLATFAAGTGFAMVSGRNVPCRCFGSTGAELGVSHLIRNGLLTLAAAAGTLLDLSGPADPVRAGAIVAAVLLGAFLGIVAVRWDGLAGLLSPVRSGHRP